MLSRLLTAALRAGVPAGLFLFLIQAVLLVPLIQKAETYESGHAHGHVTVQGTATGLAALGRALVPAAQAHGGESHGTGAEGDGSTGIDWARQGMTALTTLVFALGYSLLLCGAILVSGRRVTARTGIAWGLAGAAAFALAPALGLPPELPGSVAGDLVQRQIWWISCAAATAAGLAVLAFARAPWVIAGGVLLLIAPHLVGAPQSADGVGLVPPELAAHFASSALVVAVVFWAVLGALVGHALERAEPESA